MMHPDSAAVAEECWRAAIPVQLRLADSEVSSLEQPPVLYFMVPRQSYLHNLVPLALPLLQHLLPPGDNVPWFEHGHLPLKWGVPAGVLYDLVAAPSLELPWRLTLHFRGFPDRQLAAYAGETALRGAFFNSLKEAAHICRGSAQRIMEMSAGAQEDLWRQVLGSCLAQYQRILAPLQLAPIAPRGRGPAAIPLRLYIRRDTGGYLSSYGDIACTSRPVLAQMADGSSVSLRQALLPLLEECLRETAAAEAPPSSPAGGASGKGGGGSGTASTSASADAEVSSPGVVRGEASASSQGMGEAAEDETAAAPSDAPTAAAAAGTAAGPAAAAAGPAADPAAAPAAGGAADATSVSEAGADAVDSDAAAAATAAAAAPPEGDAVPAAGAAAAAAAVVASAGDEAAGAVAGAAGAGPAATEAAADVLERAAAAGGLLVGGTVPPLDAPLAWLHAQLHAGDYFLYVVLHLHAGANPAT